VVMGRRFWPIMGSSQSLRLPTHTTRQTRSMRPAGQCFPELHLCQKFPSKSGKEFDDVWHSNAWQADALGLRTIEKNGLTVFPSVANDGMSAWPGALVDTDSPSGEVECDLSVSHAREGFPANASGGNAVIAGLVLPNVAGDGATFETAQSVSNKLNHAMELICEQGTPISVFLAGDMLPEKCHDPWLKGVAQGMHMGARRVMWSAQGTEKTVAEMRAMCEQCKPRCPELNMFNMRHLLETKKMCNLVPLNHCKNAPGGCHHLLADTRDKRKPLQEVPRSASCKKVLSLELPFSEKSLVEDWMQNGPVSMCFFSSGAGLRCLQPEKISPIVQSVLSPSDARQQKADGPW
jgi:hypothetical protein